MTKIKIIKGLEPPLAPPKIKRKKSVKLKVRKGGVNMDAKKVFMTGDVVESKEPQVVTQEPQPVKEANETTTVEQPENKEASV